jgi:hypothetical protein
VITFKIGKTPYPFPTRWEDVTTRHCVALLNTSSLTDHISLFTGIPKETLEAAELKNLEKISLALSFLSFPPEFERSKMVGKYIMPEDVTIQSTGQMEDLRGLLMKLPPKPMEEPEIFYDLCLGACAIYCQKLRDGKYDPNKVPELKEELKDCSCVEVIGTGAFFLFRPVNLSKPLMNPFQMFFQRLKNTKAGLLISRKISDLLQRSFVPHEK